MTLSKITLDRPTLLDLETLRQLAIETFMDTYAAMNTPENMAVYIETAFNQAQLTEEIQSPHCQYWLAKMASQTVGYLKLNFAEAQTDIHDTKSLEIERIYVLPQLKGQGIGEMMLKKAFEAASQNGLEYVWLGVWDQNGKAIRFYEKNGFQKSGVHRFILGEDEQQDFIMKFVI